MNNNIILTSSDDKYGNFLVNDWLRSLKENVDLGGIDIAVMDYGLADKWVSRLKANGVIIYKGKRDGHINNIRFRDMGHFLKNKHYSQVLAVDGGDIIFQDDISGYFEKDQESFRVAYDGMETMFLEIFLSSNFPKNTGEEIKTMLLNKKMVNAGVIFAPTDKFIDLCAQCDELIINKWNYGPDQIVVNYVLYRQGFKPLKITMNFSIITVKEKFQIKNSIFYTETGEKISIVHNSGGHDIFRPIINFGYGKKHNLINTPLYFGARMAYGLFTLLKKNSS